MCEGSFLPSSFGPHQKHTEFESSLRSYPINPSPGFGEGWVKRPVALLIGSEKRGRSGQLIEASDFTVRIPMRGRCDSINVAVAAGILLFHMSDREMSSHGEGCERWIAQVAVR